MKTNRFVFSFLAAFVAAIGLSGCSTVSPTTTTQVKSVLLDPNNDAKAAQVVIAAVGNRILAKNPSYSSEVAALGDAFTALAQANATVLTPADIQAIVAKTKLDAAWQGEIVSDFNTAQGFLMTDFNVTLPTFKPIYALWLQAIANGFYLCSGHAALPLPVIPPSATPTVPAVGTGS